MLWSNRWIDTTKSIQIQPATGLLAVEPHLHALGVCINIGALFERTRQHGISSNGTLP